MIVSNKPTNKNSRWSMASILVCTLALLFIGIGCDSNNGVNDSMGVTADELLIQSIQSANDKESVNLDRIPSASQSVLSSDYSEMFADVINLAPGLGYEVGMRGAYGAQFGDRSQTYFDMDGRELSSRENYRQRKRAGQFGGKCFELVYPVTYIMPDNSTFTVESRDDYIDLREWCIANADSEERPTLQYPVEISFDDGTILTINNDEELESAKDVCRTEAGSYGHRGSGGRG